MAKQYVSLFDTSRIVQDKKIDEAAAKKPFVPNVPKQKQNTIKPVNTVKAKENMKEAVLTPQIKPLLNTSAAQSAMSRTSQAANRPIGTPTAAPIAKSVLGAGFQYGAASAFGGTKMGDGAIGRNLAAKQAENEDVFNKAKIAGQFAGTAAQYAVANQAVKAIPGLSALSASKQIVPTVAVDQLVDNVIWTPRTITEGRQQGKTGQEIGMDVLKQNATDLAINTGMALGGRAIGLVADILKKRGKPIAEALSDTGIVKEIEDATGTKQGTPEFDQLIDEYKSFGVTPDESVNVAKQAARDIEAEKYVKQMESKSFRPDATYKPKEGTVPRTKQLETPNSDTGYLKDPDDGDIYKVVGKSEDGKTIIEEINSKKRHTVSDAILDTFEKSDASTIKNTYRENRLAFLSNLESNRETRNVIFSEDFEEPVSTISGYVRNFGSDVDAGFVKEIEEVIGFQPSVKDLNKVAKAMMEGKTISPRATNQIMIRDAIEEVVEKQTKISAVADGDGFWTNPLKQADETVQAVKSTPAPEVTPKIKVAKKPEVKKPKVLEPPNKAFDLQIFSKKEFEAKAKKMTTKNQLGETNTYFEVDGRQYKGKDIDEAYTAYKNAKKVQGVKPSSKQSNVKPNTSMPKADKTAQTATDSVKTASLKVGNIEPTIKGNIPKKAQTIIEQEIEESMKVRKFSENVKTSDMTNDGVRASLTEKPLTYEPITNPETLKKAYRLIEQDFEGAVKTFELSRGTFKPESVPFARMLSNRAAELGDEALSVKIIADMAEDLTQAGQFAQAARILRQSNDPSVVKEHIVRELKKVNAEGQKKFGKKWNGIDLNDDELKMLQGIKKGATDEEKDAILEQVFDSVNKRVPITTFEKIDSWRRIAMLLNPKTTIRNVGGNAFMWGVDKFKNAVARNIEKFAVSQKWMKADEVTKSTGWKRDAELKQVVENNWNEIKDNLIKHGKYEVETGLSLKTFGKDRKVFSSKTLSTLEGWTNWLLNNKKFGDEAFLGLAYRDSLGHFMKARGIKEPSEEAMQYATQYALEATFRQANEFANFINKAKRKGGVAGKLIDAAMPFTKTPANIAVTAYNYSPAKLVELLFKRSENPAKVIDDLSKGLTGTSIVALGYGLASMGYAKGQWTAKAPEELSRAAGEQPYSIITPQGSYTFDWAQPISVPLAMGISAYEAMQDESADVLEKVTSSIFAGGDALVNQTMIMNIKEIFEGYGSTSEKIMYGLPKNYLTQMVPTLFGQVARSIDDTDRSTYSDSKAKKELNSSLLSKVPLVREGKVPIVSKGLQPRLDIWGNETGNDSGLERIAQNMLSPGTGRRATDDKATQELNRLYKATKESIIVPTILNGKITKGGKDYTMSAEELTKYQKKLGQLNYSEYNKLFKASDYKNASDEEKVEKIKRIRDANYQTIKTEFLKTKGVQ